MKWNEVDYAERIQTLCRGINGVTKRLRKNTADIDVYFEILQGLNRAVAVEIAALEQCLTDGGTGNEPKKS